MPPTRLPSLTALRFFAAAARHQHLGRAAAELHITHGAISKQIAGLEAELNARLFDRQGRGIVLTARGRRLAERLEPVFEELNSAWREAHGGLDQRPLVLSCEPTLCLKLLIPWMADLQRDLGLEVQVLAAGGAVDFRRDPIDLALRRDDVPLQDLHALPLAAEAMVPVASPASGARPEDLTTGRLTLLHSQTRRAAWADWAGRAGIALKAGREVTYQHFYLAIEAALAGQGVAIASRHMVAGDLAAGRLCPLGPVLADGSRYLLLTAPVLASDPRPQRLADWLRERLTSHGAFSPP